MCNLYSMTAARDAVTRLFRVSHNRAAAFEPFDAAFPGHAAPLIRTSSDGERELVIASWGFVLPQTGADGKPRSPRRVTNVRDDKARSAYWRDSFIGRRCLVPATAFCEPREIKPATWHWFALFAGAPQPAGLPSARPGQPGALFAGAPPAGQPGALAGSGEQSKAPRPLFAFAGIWRTWHGPVRKDGPAVDLDVFAFMTTTPNALVSTINHERMPVLLDREDQFQQWLTGTPDEAFSLVAEYPPQAMHIVQSGFEKRDMLGAELQPPAKPQGRLM